MPLVEALLAGTQPVPIAQPSSVYVGVVEQGAVVARLLADRCPAV